ncbi:hypothetical protein C8F04DRAFT_1188851 [Mycena alexandri]|uniref:Uncharacterized protein n=1 Tax=Mycena alexandri TaxID=1745969 RepID=A0AAD6SM44_9AGAR|nr:hypothetical protein C8F04DRAFT_1188851 [Mycena alexandri]
MGVQGVGQPFLMAPAKVWRCSSRIKNRVCPPPNTGGCAARGREKRGQGRKQLPAVLCAQHGVHLLVALVVRRAVEGESGCAVDADDDVGMGSALRETVREQAKQRGWR